MRVLIACEESQRVCTAFRELGHEAYSCDILPCSGGHPEWHIQGDVTEILEPEAHYMPISEDAGEDFAIVFFTCDGHLHIVDWWDLIIAHPPCTRLCSSGQRWLHWGSEEYRKKKKSEQEDAIVFFLRFTNLSCPRVAIENPVGIMSSRYRKPDCTYNPYDFKGETETKKTCLWLKGLPPLQPTQYLPPSERTSGIWRAKFDGKQYAWNDPMTATLRSRTPIGVARAMAEQWGNATSRIKEETKQ